MHRRRPGGDRPGAAHEPGASPADAFCATLGLGDLALSQSLGGHMTRFRAWADGSAARLDADEHGLALSLRDPAGQLAVVEIAGWRPMHAGHSGIRAYGRLALTDGSLHDVAAELPAAGRTAVDRLGFGL